MLEENLRLNRHVANAALIRKRRHPVIVLVLFFVLMVAGELTSDLVFLIFGGIDRFYGSTDSPVLYSVIQTLRDLIIPFASMSLVIFLWVKWREKRSPLTLGLSAEKPFAVYGRGFLIGFAAMAVFYIAALTLGVYKFTDVNLSGLSPQIALMAFITLPGWIIQSSSEEILTRGWLFQATIRKRVLTGVILSSLVFSALHLANDGITWLSMLNLSLYGLFAILYALKDENILGICGFHASWNWAQGNVFGILVSGNSVLGGSLLTQSSAFGPDWLTGGAFGAEGSILVSLILLALILGTLRNLRHKRDGSQGAHQ